MAPREKTLRLYGARSDQAPLEWSWVDRQLGAAGTYWVVARGPGHPQPRPVWGVWHDERLYLSIGSPTVRRALGLDPAITVHLDSGTDVVIVEGTTDRATQGPTSPDLIAAYNAKYDWNYDVGQYGDLLRIEPIKVIAWRAAGPAGRDSFQSTGSWTFDLQPDE